MKQRALNLIPIVLTMLTPRGWVSPRYALNRPPRAAASFNKRGAGKGGFAVLWRAGRTRPALPEPGRWTKNLVNLVPRAALALILFLLMPAPCAAYGYPGDLAYAWGKASLMVLGRPQFVEQTAQLAGHAAGLYRVDIQKAYKGEAKDRQVEFLDLQLHSMESLYIRGGTNYVLFLLAPEERKKHTEYAQAVPSEAFIGLRVFKVDESNFKIVFVSGAIL